MTAPGGYRVFDMEGLITRLLDSIAESCADSTNPKTDADRLRRQADFYDAIATAARAKAKVARTFAKQMEGSKTKAPPAQKQARKRR
jgi:hypothetical protein